MKTVREMRIIIRYVKAIAVFITIILAILLIGT